MNVLTARQGRQDGAPQLMMGCRSGL